MNIDEIMKVTVWNVTATVDKDSGIVKAGTANKWCIGVFDKTGKSLPLAKAAEGWKVDKAFGKYVKTMKHSEAVVMAHDFAVEYSLKASEKSVTSEYAACKKLYDEAKAEKEQAKELRKSHPELVMTRQLKAKIAQAEKVAGKSEVEVFKKAVATMSKACNVASNALEAKYKSELAEAEAEADELSKTLEAEAKAEMRPAA